MFGSFCNAAPAPQLLAHAHLDKVAGRVHMKGARGCALFAVCSAPLLANPVAVRAGWTGTLVTRVSAPRRPLLELTVAVAAASCRRCNWVRYSAADGALSRFFQTMPRSQPGDST